MELPNPLIVDTDEFTIADIEAVEAMTGRPFNEAVAALAYMQGSALKAVMFVVLRKHNPAVTLDDISGLSVGDLKRANVEFKVAEEESGPTEADGAGSVSSLPSATSSPGSTSTALAA